MSEESIDDFLDEVFDDSENGVCEFCEENSPTINIHFGVVMIDERTDEIVEEGDNDQCEEAKLCRRCARMSLFIDAPKEYVEAEVKSRLNSGD